MKILDSIVKEKIMNREFIGNLNDWVYFSEENNYYTNKIPKLTKFTGIVLTGFQLMTDYRELIEFNEDSIVAIYIKPYKKEYDDNYYGQSRYKYYVPLYSTWARDILNALEVNKNDLILESYRGVLCYKFVVDDFYCTKLSLRDDSKYIRYSPTRRWGWETISKGYFSFPKTINYNELYRRINRVREKNNEKLPRDDINNYYFEYGIPKVYVNVRNMPYQELLAYLDPYKLPKHCIPKKYHKYMPRNKLPEKVSSLRRSTIEGLVHLAYYGKLIEKSGGLIL